MKFFCFVFYPLISVTNLFSALFISIPNPVAESKIMALDSLVNVSGDKVQPYGGESAFSQTEHNIVAGYLITAGKMETTTECRW